LCSDDERKSYGLERHDDLFKYMGSLQLVAWFIHLLIDFFRS